MKTYTNVLFHGFLAIVLLSLIAGCQTEIVNGPVGPNSQAVGTGKQMSAATITLTCASDTATLYPDKTQQLGPLPGLASSIKFGLGTVLTPVLVTFTECTMDTAGTQFLPQLYTLEPRGLKYLQPGTLKINKSEYGGTLPTPPKVFMNIGPNTWQYVGMTSLAGAEYYASISQSGTYALGFYDSTVVVTGAKVVGPAGGTLSVSVSKLIILPGALLSNTSISMTWKDTTFGAASVTLPGTAGSANASTTYLPKLYIFGPDGAQFNVKAVLHVAFADAGFDGVNPDGVRFYYQDPVSSRWVAQETEYDPTNQEFIVYLQHFSRYCFIRY
jgi:hypothetical protein